MGLFTNQLRFLFWDQWVSKIGHETAKIHLGYVDSFGLLTPVFFPCFYPEKWGFRSLMQVILRSISWGLVHSLGQLGLIRGIGLSL